MVIGSHRFRNHFGYYLDRATAGQAMTITRRGKARARLLPPA